MDLYGNPTTGCEESLMNTVEALNAKLAERDEQLTIATKKLGQNMDLGSEKDARIERLTEAIRDAISNLGVPQPGYPSPVVEAHRILNNAIIVEGKEEKRPRSRLLARRRAAQ